MTTVCTRSLVYDYLSMGRKCIKSHIHIPANDSNCLQSIHVSSYRRATATEKKNVCMVDCM